MLRIADMPGVEVEGQPPHLNWREGLPLLVTPRVVLRELRRSDAGALWNLARLPEVARYSWPAPPNVDAFDAFITQAWRDRADGRYACFAVVLHDQTEPAGMFELRSRQPRFFRAELGLLIDPALWESGAFDDALRITCEFAFTTVGVHRMEIRTAVANAACNGALERLGVQQEAVLRGAFAIDGRVEDQYLWSIVRGVDRLAGPAEARGSR